MAKPLTVSLDRTFVLNGAFYGPGAAVEVKDKETADALTAKQSEVKEREQSSPLASSDTMAPAATVEDVNAQIASLEAVRESMLQSAPTNIFAGIDLGIVSNLQASGFDTAEKIQAASDDDLKRVKDVGPLVVSKLRDNTAQ